MSVVIDNSNGSFLSEVDSLRELIGVEETRELNEWRYLFVVHKFGLDEIVTKLNILNEEYDYLRDSNPIEHIETRIKNPKKTIEKLIRQGYPVSPESAWKNLHDIGGIRVICSFVDDVYEIYSKLANQTDLVIKEVKDYIKNPKGNGYRSLHLLVEVPVYLTDKTERVTIEVQIRTIAMDFWASLEHKLYYKKGRVVPKDVMFGLNQCADLAALLDEKMQDIRNKMRPYLSEEERAEQAAMLEAAKETDLETARTNPKTGADEPAAGAKEPAAGAEEPAAGADEPAAGADEPAAGAKEPAAGAEEPAAGAEDAPEEHEQAKGAAPAASLAGAAAAAAGSASAGADPA